MFLFFDVGALISRFKKLINIDTKVISMEKGVWQKRVQRINMYTAEFKGDGMRRWYLVPTAKSTIGQ